MLLKKELKRFYKVIDTAKNMNAKENSLKELVEQLPPDLQKEVKDFIEFLLEKKVRKTKRKLRLDWAGGLKEYRDRYTSLELQKKFLSGGATDVLGRYKYLVRTIT